MSNTLEETLTKVCSVDGCGKQVNAKSFCHPHYMKFERYGDPLHVSTIQHGGWYSPTNRSYHSMHRRCEYRGHADYKHYGGRGIKVCDRWSGKSGYVNFLADMGERPDGYSLDRIDVDGNYEPGNVRWADKITQSINKRNRSPHPGVYFSKAHGKWVATITIDTKRKSLGHYIDIGDAIEARGKAEEEYLGQRLSKITGIEGSKEQ